MYAVTAGYFVSLKRKYLWTKDGVCSQRKYHGLCCIAITFACGYNIDYKHLLFQSMVYGWWFSSKWASTFEYWRSTRTVGHWKMMRMCIVVKNFRSSMPRNCCCKNWTSFRYHFWPYNWNSQCDVWAQKLYLRREVAFFYIRDCDSSSTSNIYKFQLFGPGWCLPSSSSLLWWSSSRCYWKFQGA